MAIFCSNIVKITSKQNGVWGTDDFYPEILRKIYVPT